MKAQDRILRRASEAAWNDPELSQLLYFHALPLHQKMVAVAGMADVVRCLQRMRANGEFKPATAPRASGSR